MKLSFALSAFAIAHVGAAKQQDDVIPSELQAASLSKQLLGRQSVGTLMVHLPDTAAPDSRFNGYPFGQVELLARSCDTNDDVFIFSSTLEVTTDAFVNHMNNVTISVREEIDDGSMDALLKHRFTILGHAEPQPRMHEPGYKPIADCFFGKHPDARAWEDLGGHAFRFYRIVPQAVHYVGGFGNAHYIGWIGEEKWKQAPASAMCKDWPGCPATEDKCCPYDDDNAMKECCVRSLQMLGQSKSEQQIFI